MKEKHNLFVSYLPIFFAAFLILLWEFVPLIFNIPTYVFPKLSKVLYSTWIVKANLQVHLTTTFFESFWGFTLGSIIGFLVGLLMAEFKIFARIALPYVIGSNAVPVVAIAPLIILWFGYGILSKSVVSAFLCFFPLCINTYRGLNEYNHIYKDLFYLYGATRFEFLFKFKLLNALPFIFTGLKLNATFSVIGAIVAEFVGANAGLGFGMLQASYSLNVARLWGYIIVACILGMLMYFTVFLVEKRMFKKYFSI